MRYDIEKIANAIILALDLDVKNLDKAKLIKLLYFADKEHLKQYGKPIFYEIYMKQKAGPVTVNTFIILNASEECQGFKEYTEKLSRRVEYIEENNRNHQMPTFQKKKDLDKDIFSRSEIKVLKKVFERFKYSTTEEISAISRLLPEYEQTEMYDIIPYYKIAENMGDYVKFWNEEVDVFTEKLYL